MATLLVVGALTTVTMADPAPVAAAESGGPRKSMVFPVEGEVRYSDTWGACRSGCSRSHQGQDIMGSKLLRLIAAADGTVTYFKNTATPSGSRGNMLIITGDDGWEYWYIHVNNDSPGTDDGRQCENVPGDTHTCDGTEWAFAPGIARGARVTAGQHIGYMGDSGNAEGCDCAHVHFELHDPDGPVNAYNSLQNARHFVLDQSPGAQPIGYLDDVAETSGEGCMHYVADEGYGWDSICEQGPTPEVVLRDHWESISTGQRLQYGRRDDQLLFCDWNGDGTDTPGVYRAETAVWLLSDSLHGSTESPDRAFRYGRPGVGDIVLCGDWDGDGVDTPGVFRTSDNNWYLRNSNSGGNAHHTFRYGRPGLGDVPLVGDWDGDGTDTPGVFRGQTNEWHLRNGHAGVADRRFVYGNPRFGDRPVVGDFDGDGISTIAVARGETWFVNNRLRAGAADRDVPWLPGAVPTLILAADWDGDGVDEPIADLYRDVDAPSVDAPATDEPEETD